MYLELSFDVITHPCAPGIIVHQESFLQNYLLCLDLLGRNHLISDPWEVLIQVDEVNLKQVCILIPWWFASLCGCLQQPPHISIRHV